MWPELVQTESGAHDVMVKEHNLRINTCPQCREQIKALKEREQALKKQVEALRVELAGCGVSLSQLEAARLAKEQEQQAQEEEREVVHAINGWLKGESRREPWQEMSA